MVECNFCGATFTSRNKLFDHLRQDHSDLDKDGRLRRNIDHQLSGQERTSIQLASRSQLRNADRVAYYRGQCTNGNNVMTEQDLMTAEETFRSPLPTAFRFSRSINRRTDDPRHVYGDHLRWKLFPTQSTGDGDNEDDNDNVSSVSSALVKSSPFFDPNTVFVATKPTREWDRDAQQALSDAQDVGAVNRQELCSMIPVSLLLSSGRSRELGGEEEEDMGHANALDLCAAPGSKTLQLIDEILTRCNSLHNTADNEPPMMLVVNDTNPKRLATVFRRSRQHIGQSNLIFNASDGRHFPSLRKWGGYKLKFQYVLADVPCSGDGTLRKQGEKEWANWQTRTHLKLHKLQVRLLERALQLVKKGGRAVYSTCSLDPIENEAVVSQAILKLGGPKVFKIIEPSQYLDDNAAKPFPYCPGATQWSVPHPKFSEKNPIMFNQYSDVPEDVRKSHISHSMFPPKARIRQNENDAQPVDEKADDEKQQGEISKDDAKALESMLPNCRRILPHHLDSGGFFCAVIERLCPVYFAICCPQQREKDNITCDFHGRIYYPVKSSDQIRQMLSHLDEEVYYEGHSSVEGAIRWLHQHNAYVPDRSTTLLPPPTRIEGNVKKMRERVLDSNRDKQWAENNRQPTYTPFFKRPNHSLVREFCDFYGVIDALPLAKQAGVERFATEDLIVIGGGDKAPDVTSYVAVEEHKFPTRSRRERKYFKLALVSKEIQSLFSGAAKFTPVETGLTLTMVPIPDSGLAFELENSDETNNKSSTIPTDIRYHRYGLTDEAAEVIGRFATKRIIDLNRHEIIQLLTYSVIHDNDKRFDELSPGGVVVMHTIDTNELDQKALGSLRLSCSLQLCCKDEPRKNLILLTKKRVAQSWLRLLEVKDA